jgi:hypothetical protein
VVKENCSEDEVEAYLKPVSQMLALGFDVLDLIHKEYPELKPASMSDWLSSTERRRGATG